MNDAAFWSVIRRFRSKGVRSEADVLRPALKKLVKLSAEDIIDFRDLLANKLFALDTREHARACYLGEVDVDDPTAYIPAEDFLYSRCVVVANGPAAYQQVVEDPTLFPQGLEFEGLVYLPADAYRLKTGQELLRNPAVSWETFSNKQGWATGH
jgi:hypothetical protein